MQVLAVQTADEARHIEVFTRRARLPAPGARAGIPAAPRRRLRRRHDALRHTAGLNDEVFDALLLMAAGSWDHDALRLVAERVMRLMHDMDEGRRKR